MYHWGQCEAETHSTEVYDVTVSYFQQVILYAIEAFYHLQRFCVAYNCHFGIKEQFIPEMYRYYSNIVGKYGVFVQKALAKLSSIKLDYICPTHGPVWHDELSFRDKSFAVLL